MLHKDLINQVSQLAAVNHQVGALDITLEVLIEHRNEDFIPKYLNDMVNSCNVLFALMQNIIATLKKIHSDCEIRLNQLSSLFSTSPNSLQAVYLKEYNLTLRELNWAKENSQGLDELMTGFAQQLSQAMKQLEKRDLSLFGELTSNLAVKTAVVIVDDAERIAEGIDRAINLQNSLVAELARTGAGRAAA